MSSEVLVGLVGLVGAFLGAAGGVAGSVVSGRHQLKQVQRASEESRRKEWFDAQLQACIDFIEAARAFPEVCWELADELHECPESLEDISLMYRERFLPSWGAVTRAHATLRVLCSQKIADRAGEVRAVLVDLERTTREWYRAYGLGASPKSQRRRVQDLYNEVRISPFAEAARAEIMPPESPNQK